MEIFRKTVAQGAAIVLVSSVAAVGTYMAGGAPSRLFYCDPTKLGTGEVCLRDISREAKILWVDARTRKEWEENGLRGSMLWSLAADEDKNAFEAEAATRMMEEEMPEVIVYCGGDDCHLSHQVAGMIQSLGFGVRVRVLKGGWRALDEAGWIKDSSSGF